MKNADIGAALDGLTEAVKARTLQLVAEYRFFGHVNVLKQAVDTPHRARTQIAAWVAEYNGRHGAGTAQTFLAACLTAAGSEKTLAQIDNAIAAVETQAQVLVSHVQNDAWTWDQVASAIEAQISVAAQESFTFAQLPIPVGYTTVWGESWR